MAATLAQIIAKAEAWTQDDAARIGHTAATSSDFGIAVLRAIERYSRDRERIRYVTANGDGSTYEFAVTSLTGWVAGFSRLVRVELAPTGSARVPDVVFDENAPNDPEDVQVLRDGTGAEKVTFTETTPPSGTGNVRFRYTALHAVDAASAAATTIPSTDLEAFSILVAAYACEMLASKYSETSDGGLAVDGLDYRSKADAYAVRARRLREEYERAMAGPGADGEAPRAASATVDWDVSLANRRDRLFHRGALR